jgi:hypothetical protein
LRARDVAPSNDDAGDRCKQGDDQKYSAVRDGSLSILTPRGDTTTRTPGISVQTRY